jgi:hypothetical protein
MPVTRKLSRSRTLKLLDELESMPGPAVSLYIPSRLPLPKVEKMLINTPGTQTAFKDVVGEVAKSNTGVVLFWGEYSRYLIVPPFPVSESPIFQGYEVELLRSLLEKDFTIALILVRLGAYAIGVFQGEKLLSSKVGTGLVHSRHKKGGSSQHRFERHRDKQIEFFFGNVCTRMQEQLGPYSERIDHVFYGGEHTTIVNFKKQCRYSSKLDEQTVETLLTTRRPKQASLEEAIQDAWSSRVIQWHDG